MLVKVVINPNGKKISKLKGNYNARVLVQH